MSSTIVILGSGNVATHLSEVLLNSGYSVLQCWKRGEILKDADLYFIAVSDDAIEDTANLIPVDKFFAHTSGSVDLKRGGVFYPLQTFSKGIELEWKNIPILIESSDDGLKKTLLAIAKRISSTVLVVQAEERLFIHLCAVFSGNFANRLWALSEKLLSRRHIPFDILKPLIFQTVHKIANHSPRDVQTGPAARNDLTTMERHRQILEHCSDAMLHEDDLITLYNIFSKSIRNDTH